MTLVEFLAPLTKKTHRDRVLAVLYYKERYEKTGPLTVEQIRTGLKSARAKGWKSLNIADVLSKTGHFVHSPGSQGNRLLWELTDSGRKEVRDMLGLPEAEPEIEHDVGLLENLAIKITDKEARGYVEESITCLQVGALRAAVVFLWVGAVRTLQQRMLKRANPKLNAAVQKHDAKARKISRIDHFAYIKDKTTLLAAQELGILDKSEKDTLEEALNLRNRSGHPAKYKPGIKKVSAYIEDVINNVF